MTTTPVFQPPGLAARTTSLGQLLTHIEDPDRRQLAHRLLTEITAATAVPHYEQRVATVLDLIETHRRLRNVRECAGCDWRPVNPGYASDPDATLRRHQSFNEHLARMIVEAVR